MASFIDQIMGSFLGFVSPKRGDEGEKKNPMSNEQMDEFLIQRYGDLRKRGKEGEDTLLQLRKMYQNLWLEEQKKKEQRALQERGQHRLNYHKGNRPGSGEYSMPYRTYEPPAHPDSQRGSGFFLQPPATAPFPERQGMPSRQYPGITITPGIRG